jgi:hypothetical protein
MKQVFCIISVVCLIACKQNNNSNINSKNTTAELSGDDKKLVDSLSSPAKPDSSAVFVWVDSLKHLSPMIDGEEAATTFTFKNGGNTPLVIKSVTGSCGCTQASSDKFLYNPNETGIISIKFNSKGKGTDAPNPAPMQKTVTVEANTQKQTHAAIFDVIVKSK